MSPGRPRDVALREVSRNLRYADRDRAIEAAAAMSEDYELRTFSPAPDKLTRQLAAGQRQHDAETDVCVRFIKGLKPERANAADERRIRDCLSMDDPPGMVAPPLPPYALILSAADALPPGRTKAELLYMATWVSVPDRPPGGALEAVRRLRTLIPRLGADIRQAAAGWLETTDVDLIEGRPDTAIARVAKALQKGAAPDDALPDEPSTKARGLIQDFLQAKDIDRALTVTNLLPPSNDCMSYDDGLTGVMLWVLPLMGEAEVAAYMERLQTSGSWKRLCPNGVGDEIATEVWLKAGNEAKALEAAAASRKPLVLARTRFAVVERRLRAGDTSSARSVALASAATPVPLDSGTVFDRSGAAGSRVRLIYQLAKVGEAAEAERLASAYPGAGWRGFAYSVIVATTNRERAGPDWGGPFLDLQEVPADQ